MKAQHLFRILEVGLGLVFLGAIAHHVAALDFRPLAAFTLPILLVYFGFASLQYTRSRALVKGAAQRRSLYAAERAVQATVWHLLGVMLGTGLSALLSHVGVAFDPAAPSLGGLWLLLFLAPYALMQIGLLVFMRAIWTIAPDLLRRVKPLELSRRMSHG